MNSFVKPLLRIASIKGRGILDDLVTGQFEIVQDSGKVMIGAQGINKNYTFAISEDLTVKAIMEAADAALAWFDSHSTDELTRFLKRRATSVAIVRFPSNGIYR